MPPQIPIPNLTPTPRQHRMSLAVMDDVPPEIPGREHYWIARRRRVHRATCGYVRHQRLTEWVEERGRSVEEISRDAARKGKVIWWCLRCYPQAHPWGIKAPHKWKAIVRFTNEISFPENS